MKFIIEHLEPEVYDWCVIEYRHISKIVGKDNLIITNVKNGADKLKGFGEIKKESVIDLNLKNSCILDPEADKTISSSDSKFDYLIFGGILGDYPPKKRTKVELSSKMRAELRNIGKEQMSTDTAVLVSKEIIEGKSLKDFEFQDGIEIPMGECESIILPFRYVSKKGKPVLPEGLIEYFKENDGF